LKIKTSQQNDTQTIASVLAQTTIASHAPPQIKH